MADSTRPGEKALTSRQLLARGLTAHQRGHLAEAEGFYLRALRRLPGFFDAQHLLGVLRSQQGRDEEALALVAAALKTRANSPGALTNHGLILYKLKRYSEALISFDKAIALQPDHDVALNNRGNVLSELGRDAEALASYVRAMTATPGYADAYSNLGVLLKELGRIGEAEAASTKALRLNPKLIGAYINLADCKTFAADDPQLATMRTLEHDDSLPEADRVHLHFALGKVFADLGDHRRAFEQARRGNAIRRARIPYDEAATMALFEHIETVLTRDLVAARTAVGDASPVPIFVVGMPGSGTTLIEQILASHHGVYGAGELTALSDIVGSIYAPDGKRVGYPDFVAAADDALFTTIGARYAIELGKLAPHALRVVDKMPWNFLLTGLIHLILPNARIIHVARDPADTCVSCYFRLSAGDTHHTYDLAELGRYYRRYQRLMAHWHAILPNGSILDVHYEDVVADLETAARRMLAHCGLEWDPHCLRFEQTSRRVRTASATQVRRAIYKTSIGRWRNYEPYLGPLLETLFGADQPA